jgi:heme/copper-type cytochrome/quinol oxidase subunit 4
MSTAPDQPLPSSAPIRLNRGRPWQVSVIAYLAIVIGYLGVLLKPATSMPFLSDMKWLVENWQPPTRLPYEWEFQIVVVLILGFIQSTICLVSGWGLLRMREWARKGILIYAGLSLLMTGAYVAFQLYSSGEVVSRTITSTSSVLNPADLRAQHLGMVVMSTLTRLPFLFLIFGFMTSRHIKQAFARQRLAAKSS